MLQIRHLSITQKKDLRTILSDFSCTLNAGDKAAIIGEEGNGKSTLLKWLYAPALIEGYAQATGERLIQRERLAYLPQELPKETEQISVYAFFSEEPAFWEKTPKELGRLAKDFCVPPEFFYNGQQMGTLSGGEKVKAQLMRLLLTDPTVLLLDEPSNDLDIHALEWLEGLILGWPWAVLFISHDDTLIERTANMVIHLEQLKKKSESRCTVAHVPYLQYQKERAAKFENQRRQAFNDRREKKLREEKLHKIEQSVTHKLDNIAKADRDGKGRLLKKKMKAVKSMAHRFERESNGLAQMPQEETAIFFRLGDKRAAIPAGKGILDFSLERLYAPASTRLLAKDIHLKVRGAEKICIVGNNGAGKTTLLKQIASELLGRTDIHAEYMPQNYEDLLDATMAPVDYLDTSGRNEERTKIRTFLGALKYTADEMAHPIAELSGGQKAKTLLLKMSLSGANVLLLDEPTRNFSPLSGPVIRKMLAGFPGAIISVSHDRKYMDEVCDKVYRLTEDGLQLETHMQF